MNIGIAAPTSALTDYGQQPYLDKDGHTRDRARVRWWSAGSTLRDLAEISGAFTTTSGLPYPVLPAVSLPRDDHRYRDDVPVFYGHYWRSGTPERGVDWTERTACVDFSAVKGGSLTAYRWSGERTVRAENYVQVR